MSCKVAFLVDGFNLYHSLKDLERLTGASVKWLDLRRLCGFYLHAVRSAIGERVDLAGVHWYSARPDFLSARKPGTLIRYDTYVAALRASGVEAHLSQFKRKTSSCPHCGKEIIRHEEKETDVAIAVGLYEQIVHAECETVVLMSGDTDLIPATRSVNWLLPRTRIGVAFPFLRHNAELEQVAQYSFKLNQRDIQKAQFPQRLQADAMKAIDKPGGW